MAVQTQILHRRDTAANWTSTNPTLGSAEIGVETDTNKFKIGNGSSSWTALSYQGGSATFQMWRKAASGGETSLSGSDDFSTTLAYTVGAEQVFINGVLLERGVDYTASTGTSITGLTALVAGDIATVVSTSSLAIANTIPLSTVTAKGDLIAASGASTVTNLAVGADGTTLVANSASATGMAWAGPTFTAGKNKVINGDFGIWQRGTTATPVSGYGFGPDRFLTYSFGTSTSTISQQTFTPGTAPIAGYESQYFCRIASTNSNTFIENRIEDVRTFAGQTVTLSFWAKSASAQSLSINAYQNFGTGGSSTVTALSAYAPAITTSWARYSVSFNFASIAGKTIGTGGYLILNWYGAINNNLDLWGVQLEAGSVATPFTTATGTLQGELAACQRYYFKLGGEIATQFTIRQGGYYDANYIGFYCPYPQPMRVAPSVTAVGNPQVYQSGTAYSGFTWNNSIAGNPSTQNQYICGAKASHGLTVNFSTVLYSATTSDYIGVSAEL
jgi:hypothetical protein